MVNTTPEEGYKNAVVLYHWRKCGYCVKMKPEWEQVKRALPGSTAIYEIEVEDNREALVDMGVDLGGGVPRVEVYNQDGDKMVYNGARVADEMVPAIMTHLISTSPQGVEESKPCLVLYFRHSCGFCVRFLPEFLAFAGGKGVGCVKAVDTEKYTTATSRLSPPATTVPHVVYHAGDGSQTVFRGDRTSSGLRQFVSDQEEESGKNVSFEGGSLKPATGSTEPQLEEALDTLQKKSLDVLGKRFGRTFEPENASVCFIGKRTSSTTPDQDRIFILICPNKIPRGKRHVMAGVYGSRRGVLTVKIYVDTDMEAFIRNKRAKGFKPVPETNPNVQALETFGYYVEME
jgi:thiol-disulfide isomerase/thioredoxin